MRLILTYTALSQSKRDRAETLCRILNDLNHIGEDKAEQLYTEELGNTNSYFMDYVADYAGIIAGSAKYCCALGFADPKTLVLERRFGDLPDPENPKVMLAALRLAKYGLNLTEAESYVSFDYT